jgi:hypothetical protein
LRERQERHRENEESKQAGLMRQIVQSGPGPVLELALAALTYAVTMPLVTIITTYLYFHLITEEALSPAQPKRALVLLAEV